MSQNKIQHTLTKKFFNRPTLAVAQELLGTFLVREYKGQKMALQICEVEAYDGPHDLASHASRGKTERTSIMFGQAGYWYVYLVYGMHYMLNIVTDAKDYPAAVLIRTAGEYDGPAKLTKALHINKQFNNTPATHATGLWIEQRPILTPISFHTTPRIGVSYAGPEWSGKPYRFVMDRDTPFELSTKTR